MAAASNAVTTSSTLRAAGPSTTSASAYKVVPVSRSRCAIIDGLKHRGAPTQWTDGASSRTLRLPSTSSATSLSAILISRTRRAVRKAAVGGRQAQHAHKQNGRAVADMWAGAEGGLMERPLSPQSTNGAARSRSLYVSHTPDYDLAIRPNQRVEETSPGGESTTVGSNRQVHAAKSEGALRSDERSGAGGPEMPEADLPGGPCGTETEIWRDVSEGDLDHVLASLEDRFAGDLDASPGVMEANARVLLTIGARKGQVLRIFRSQPNLVAQPIGDAVREKAQLLASFRVAPPAVLKAISRSLEWLSTPAAHAATVLQYLDRDLGINNLARVVSMSPHVLSQPLDGLHDTVSFLRTDLALGAEVGAALERNPALLGECDCVGSRRGRADVVRKLDRLRGLLRLRHSADVLPLVQRSPPLLSADPDDARETYRTLAEVLGEKGAAAVAVARPQVLALPPAAVKEVLAHIVRRFGGAEGAASMISNANASLLRRKWDRTHSKLEFVTSVMGRDMGEVAAWPAVLSCNLQARLKRRFTALQAAGMGADEPLRAIFGCSDGVFQRRFGVTLPTPTKGKRGRKPKS